MLLVLMASSILFAATKPSKPQTHLVPIVQIDPTITKLPLGYTGASIERLFSVFAQTKGEFEKTEDYERRVERLPFGTYAVRLKQEEVSTEYDADAERLTVRLMAAAGADHEAFTIRGSLRELGSYVGENGFGKKVRVARQMMHLFSVWDIAETSRNLDDFYISTQLDMPSAAARRMKSSISVLLTFELTKESPKLSKTEAQHLEPRIDFPNDVYSEESKLACMFRELWFVDSNTGQVLQKVSVAHKATESQ